MFAILLFLISMYIRLLAIVPRFLETTHRKDAEYANKHPKTALVVRFLLMSRIGFIFHMMIYVGLFVWVFSSMPSGSLPSSSVGTSLPVYDALFIPQFIYLAFSVPFVILALRFAVIRNDLVHSPSSPIGCDMKSVDEIWLLFSTTCLLNGAWKSESGRQADTPHFWINISMGERIFMLITPFHLPIIAFGHMGTQGLRLKGNGYVISKRDSSSLRTGAGSTGPGEVWVGR